LGGLATLTGAHSDVANATADVAAHSDVADATADVAKVRLVNAVSAPPGSPGLTAATAAAAVSSPPTAPLSAGAGSAVLPGVSVPGATVRRKGRFARRYGFRPAATTRPVAGG
jgi:hypothetical protein